MTHPTRVHLPDDDYLVLVGQMAYMVSDLEGLILHDLEGLAEHLPDNLTVGRLAGMTTRNIATSLENALPDVTDADVHAYLARAVEKIRDINDLRNDVLHARPATSPGEGARLNRWKPADGRRPDLAFCIDTAWLKSAIDRLSEASSDLNAIRPTHKSTSFTSTQDG